MRMRASSRAAVVAIGDELVGGRAVDTNSSEIARALFGLGLEVERVLVLGDAREAIQKSFQVLCAEHALVVATGGLGPTLDDVTREAAAAAAGVGSREDPVVLEWLRVRWRARGLAMPAANARQAQVPEGSEIMPNACGTAPGFRLGIGDSVLAVLPGPPLEMRDMLARELLPWLARTRGPGPGLGLRELHLAGLSESTFADRAGDWMAREANPLMGVTADHGVLHVSLRARAATSDRAQALCEARAEDLRERFAAEVYSQDEPRLELALARALIARGLSLATAESCTGGLVARLLTDAPGVSAVFREGWVTYSDAAKVRRLGVPAALIGRHGSVSGEVAAAMASGAARESGARLALSVTGIAGPAGGSERKPVGLVWLGLCVDGATSTRELRLPQVGREQIRLYAAHAALDLVRRHLPPAASRGAD